MFEFPKQNRILNRNDFDRIVENGSKVVSSRLVVIALNNVSSSRLGLIVSKKVGNAVERNRVKRMVREAFRHRLPNLAGWDLVVIGRAKAKSSTSHEIERDLDYCLRHLVKKSPASAENTEATCFAASC
jgi:ribonuclease P protein component